MHNNDDKEVVRIKVKLCDGLMQPEHKKLCIDPQITSFEVLHSLLAKAFGISDRPFAISYLCRSGSEKDVYISLLTDWDLDAAVMDSSSPYLRLKVDLRPFDEGIADWDLMQTENTDTSRLAAVQNTLLETLSKTVSTVSKAIGISRIQDGIPMGHELSQIRPPLSDAEFRTFLNPVGQLIDPAQFRLTVYAGGVEPSLRRVVWRHLLNVYPAEMNGRERYEYFKQKCSEYTSLREKWRACARLSEHRPSVTNLLSEPGKIKPPQSGNTPSTSAKPPGVASTRIEENDVFQNVGGLWTPENLMSVTSAVKKDVLRTDRRHPYFSGEDDSGNVIALFNVLVTYALTHPTVSYCQGMSDLAAPLLVVEGDEAGAYVCFVALMNRLRYQFSGECMSVGEKINHLGLLLEHHDPTFYAFLKERHANDLFFTYRWLLLETKREFPLDDAMYALEVMWATLPVNSPPDKEKGLILTDSDYLTVDPASIIRNSGGAAYVSMKSNRRRLSSEPSSKGSEAAANSDKFAGQLNIIKGSGVKLLMDNTDTVIASANKLNVEENGNAESLTDGSNIVGISTQNRSTVACANINGNNSSIPNVNLNKSSIVSDNLNHNNISFANDNVNVNANHTNIPVSHISVARVLQDEKQIREEILDNTESLTEVPASINQSITVKKTGLDVLESIDSLTEVSTTISQSITVKKTQLDLGDLHKLLSSSSAQGMSPSELLTPGDELNPQDFISLKTEEMEELERASVNIDTSLTEEEAEKSPESSHNVADTQISVASIGSEVFGEFSSVEPFSNIKEGQDKEYLRKSRESCDNVTDTDIGVGSDVFGDFVGESISNDLSIEMNVLDKLCSLGSETVACSLEAKQDKLHNKMDVCDHKIRLDTVKLSQNISEIEDHKTKTHSECSICAESNLSQSEYKQNTDTKSSASLYNIENVPQIDNKTPVSTISSLANGFHSARSDSVLDNKKTALVSSQDNAVGNKQPSFRNIRSIRSQSESSFKEPQQTFSTRRAISVGDTNHIEGRIIDLGNGMCHVVYLDHSQNYYENNKLTKETANRAGVRGTEAALKHSQPQAAVARSLGNCAVNSRVARRSEFSIAGAIKGMFTPAGSSCAAVAATPVVLPAAAPGFAARVSTVALATTSGSSLASGSTLGTVSSLSTSPFVATSSALATSSVLARNSTLATGSTLVAGSALAKPPGSARAVTTNAASSATHAVSLAKPSVSSSDLINLNSDCSLLSSRLKPPQLKECRRLSDHRDSLDSSDETTELTSLLKLDARSDLPITPPTQDVSIDFVRVARPPKLPLPEEFGNGNPFLMFLCLAMLLQHRHYLMSNDLDYDDISLHYSRQVRKQNVLHIVAHARSMYGAYLRQCKQEGENSARKGENV